MRVAEISRNSFEDDNADEADFSAYARLHPDFRFGQKLTRRARALNSVARSASPAMRVIVIPLIAALPLCLPLLAFNAWQPISLESAGGGQPKPEPGL